MSKTTCPICGSASVEVLAREHPERRAGVDTVYTSELSRCSQCGEEFLTVEQSMAHSRARADAIRESAGLLTPAQIRLARLGLGLTQRDFEHALGVGEKTVVRWERGTVVPSQAANGLLWVALNHPDVFRLYMRARESRSERKSAVVIAAIVPASSAQEEPQVLQRYRQTAVTTAQSGDNTQLVHAPSDALLFSFN